jgi:hypothetical protein
MYNYFPPTALSYPILSFAIGNFKKEYDISKGTTDDPAFLCDLLYKSNKRW